jgi:tetratricopeptide (TPR) repeat protein
LPPKTRNTHSVDAAEHTTAHKHHKSSHRNALIALVFVLVLAGLWGGYSFGQDRGWGNSDRAVKNKMEEAQQAFVDRRLDKAVRLYLQVSQRYPSHPQATQALTQLATAYEEKGQLEEAVKAYQQLLGKLGSDPGKKDLSAFTQLQISKLLQEKGDYANALKGFEKVRLEHPKTDWSGEAMAGIGRVYQQQKAYDKGIEAYQAVIKELPHGFLAAEAQSAIGECLEAQGEPGKAMKAYQKVVDDYPSAVWDQAKSRIEALKLKMPVASKGKAKSKGKGKAQ